MAVDVFDSITAREIIVGNMAATTRPSTPKTGTLGISGALLVFYDGTGWKKITST